MNKIKSVIILLIIIIGFIIGLNCHRDNPIKPHLPHPEHPAHPRHPDLSPTVIHDTTEVPIIFEIVDLAVEGDVIIDISPNNIYVFKRNGIEEERVSLLEISQIPRTVIISHTFKNYKILEDTFSIDVIGGSRAAVKGVRVVEIIFKE